MEVEMEMETTEPDNQTVRVQVNRRQRQLNRNELEALSKEELIDKVLQLEAYNLQLKNILDKKNNELKLKTDSDQKASTSNKRTFDFSKAQKRHVLIKFLYFGWDYQGLSSQEDTNDTIECHMFDALLKTCLIESRVKSNYNRCGRTDKGVSAFCQVISIDVRSKYAPSEQMSPENIFNEIDYCNILNRVLPKNIKCISWMPLNNSTYSARKVFDCIRRTYRYFFPIGNLNIEAMRNGCKYLIGTHDFRNLCKMDVANGVTNFVRTIYAASIEPCRSQTNENKGYDMYYLLITSHAFIWHQIRCIMSVLLLIGENLEEPLVISELLNIRKNPCKPQYAIANGMPLNLYNCEFSFNSTDDYNRDDNNSPGEDSPEPIANSPITAENSPVTEENSPVAVENSPVTGEHSPVTAENSPAAVEDSTTTAIPLIGIAQIEFLSGTAQITISTSTPETSTETGETSAPTAGTSIAQISEILPILGEASSATPERSTENQDDENFSILIDPNDTTEWHYSKDNLEKLIEILQIEWSSYNIKATMIRECLEDLIDTNNDNFDQATFKSQAKFLQVHVRQKQYQKLLTRKRCESLENRLQHFVKKQRLTLD